MNVRTLPAAAADLLGAARALEAARAGTGVRLLEAYRAALENVERFPAMYPAVDDELPGRDARNVLLGRFNYRIVYEVRTDEVLVVAVLHTARRAGLWHPRLADE